jgi:ketosteroid isomerase-like protein
VDPHEAARRWVSGYSAAWRGRDANLVASLYADDTVYRSHPFRDPLHGRGGVLEYSRWAFSSEQDVEFWFGEPVAAGDAAAVEYWAIILDQRGTISTLAGTVMLRFDESGRVAEHRDYWALEEGRRLPYDGWSGGDASIRPPQSAS